MTTFTESVVEQAALAWLESLGWRVTHRLAIAPGEPEAERADYAQVVPEARLRDALARLNPALPPEALADALRRLTRPRRSRVGGAQSRAAGRGVVGSCDSADSEVGDQPNINLAISRTVNW